MKTISAAILFQILVCALNEPVRNKDGKSQSINGIDSLFGSLDHYLGPKLMKDLMSSLFFGLAANDTLWNGIQLFLTNLSSKDTEFVKTILLEGLVEILEVLKQPNEAEHLFTSLRTQLDFVDGFTARILSSTEENGTRERNKVVFSGALPELEEQNHPRLLIPGYTASNTEPGASWFRMETFVSEPVVSEFLNTLVEIIEGEEDLLGPIVYGISPFSIDDEASAIGESNESLACEDEPNNSSYFDDVHGTVADDSCTWNIS